MWQSAEIRVYFIAFLTLYRRASAGGAPPRPAARTTLLLLEPDVFVRRRIREGGDQGEGWFLHPWADASNESILPDRREHHAVVQDPLDLVEHLLAFLPVDLFRLALE